MKEGSEAFGNGEDDLADGYVGNNVIHQVNCSLGHAPGVAGGAGAPALAGERDEEVVPTGGASDPSEAVGQDTALEVAPEFLFHMIRHAVSHGVGLIGQGQVGLQVLPDDAVERRSLGTAPPVGLGRDAGRWSGRLCGPPGLPASRVGLDRHQRPPASRGVERGVSTSRTADRWGGRMEEGARGQAIGRKVLSVPARGGRLCGAVVRQIPLSLRASGSRATAASRVFRDESG
jgi:hypothetical protein